MNGFDPLKVCGSLSIEEDLCMSFGVIYLELGTARFVE